jgi:hypothetical protein
MLTDEKIDNIAAKFSRLIGDHWQHENGIPDSEIYDFARAIEDFVREDQLMIATMARYKSHLKETRCGRCGRPYWHHLEELRKKGEYTNS